MTVKKTSLASFFSVASPAAELIKGSERTRWTRGDAEDLEAGARSTFRHLTRLTQSLQARDFEVRIVVKSDAEPGNFADVVAGSRIELSAEFVCGAFMVTAGTMSAESPRSPQFPASWRSNSRRISLPLDNRTVTD